jgi:uncharacterized protein YjdB
MRFPLPTSLRGAATLGVYLASAVLAGCSKEFYTGVPSVDRVELSISPRVINVSTGAQAIGTAYDGSRVITNSRVAVSYKSENAAVALVNPTSGAISGLAPGVAYIVASAGGKEKRDSVIVRLIPARSVLFGTRNPRFRVGATNTLVAAALDSASRSITDRLPQYRSTNEAVLTINSNGIVTPRAAGTAQVIATVDNGLGGGPSVADTVTATVTPVPVTSVRVDPSVATRVQGETQQYTATITDSLGATVADRAVQWVSSNANVASVDQASGLVTALAPGSTTISAFIDRVPGEAGQVGSNGAALTVQQVPAASVTVTPASVSLKLTAPLQQISTSFTVVVRDAAGNRLFNRNLRIVNAPDPNVARVVANADGTYTVTAVGPGSTSFVFQARDATDQQNQGTPGTLNVTVAP